jgi:hypothetical protein
MSDYAHNVMKELVDNSDGTESIKYYIFDRIEKDEYGLHQGWIGSEYCEVFDYSDDDTDEYLWKEGFAKCDAPEWDRTMVVEESAYRILTS